MKLVRLGLSINSLYRTTIVDVSKWVAIRDYLGDHYPETGVPLEKTRAFRISQILNYILIL